MHRELVVLSHLRWDWVWQRPQHLISRIGRGMDRTWFVEEPVPAAVERPSLAGRREGDVERLWMEVPDPRRDVGFDFPFIESYRRQLPERLGQAPAERIVWLYTPLALHAATALHPTVLVYDVMDDLASFKGASPALAAAHREALELAHVVFVGGRTLHRSVVELGRPDAHLFPSGVEPAHYEQARHVDRRGDRRVAGYVGVIDERIDLRLLTQLAMELADWEIRMVGPITKIDPQALPQLPNLTFSGPEPYARLPEVMAGFDVALMPFADNESTRSISPTKTLEYLAAGLPVVSTPVPDVVASFSTIVDIQTGAAQFAEACRRVVGHDRGERDEKLRPLLDSHDWDVIAADMASIIADVVAEASAGLTA